MPPRRSHKKSRAGCRRCKNRKIKCDEVHPRCGNCAKHGVLCDFGNPNVVEELVASTSSESTGTPTPKPAPATFHTRKNSSIRDSTSPVAAPTTPLYLPLSQPAPSPSMSSQVDRMLELRLMHHYTTYTSKTLLTNSPATQDIWQRTVPQMAFSGKTYLADAILSVAALHLRSQTPDDKALVRASHAYAASTLAAYCASLNSGITPENAEALFLTASLIAFQATASRIFIKDDPDADPGDPASRYALPVGWFHAFQGVKTVVATSWQWIRNSATVRAVIDSQPSFQLNLNPRAPGSFFGHLLEGFEDEIAAEAPQHIAATSQAYSHAICTLNWAHKNRLPGGALAFPATVSKRFVELVEARRPRALAILACFFALLKRMDDVWWLQDVARREVMGLVGTFEPGSKWWRHLEWPVRIALWDGQTIPPDTWGADCEAEESPQEGLAETMMHHIELMAEILSQSHPVPSVPVQDEPYMVPDSPD